MTLTMLADVEREYEEEAAALAPYDACMWLGRPFSGRIAYDTPTALRDALTAGPIKKALISCTASELYDPDTGNDELADALAELPGLYGVMTLLPHDWGDVDSLDVKVSINVNRGLRAVRLYPKSHRYSLRIPSMKPLLSLLESLSLPLFIHIGQTSWDEIGPLAQAYPKLPILVESAGHHEYLNMRHALPWLEASPNLLVPTNRQFLCGGLELLVERLGADRILFSSCAPTLDPNAALGPLVFSRLPRDVRQRIAHENLERLLAGVETRRARP